MAHTRRVSACKQIGFQGSPGSGKTRQAIALMALFARRFHGRTTEFAGQPLPTWAYRLIRAWRNNPYVTGAAPRALPITVSTPMRVTTTWEREVLGAYPGAELMMIDSFRDVDTYMARCAESTAPTVVAVFSQSKTRAFSLDWEPAVITRARSRTVPVLAPERARRAVLTDTPQGPVWVIPDYAPTQFSIDDEAHFLAFLAAEGVDTTRPWSLNVAGFISFDAGDRYEIEDRQGTWTLHALSAITPLIFNEKTVGWLDPHTGQVITEVITESIFFCPDCGHRIEAMPQTKGGTNTTGTGANEDAEETLVPVTSLTYFKRQQRTCANCTSPLWQRRRTDAATKKWPMPTFAQWSAALQQLHDDGALPALGNVPTTRRITRVEPDEQGEGLVISLGREAASDFSPYEYMLMKYAGCVALHLADEAHNARGANTDISRSIHYAFKTAQTYAILSGTISGGMLDGLYHLLFRFKPAFWTRLGLGWGDVEAAIQRYGFTQETVTEHQGEARKGSGKSDVTVTTVPAPGMSAKLIPMLLESLIFIDAPRDLGAFMPDMEEIPDVVDMDDPEVQRITAEAKAQVQDADATRRALALAYTALMNDPGAADHERATAQTELDAAAETLHAVEAHAKEVKARVAQIDLAAAYKDITGTLEDLARKRIQPAILAKGMLPRWWATLPCVRPAFKVTRTLRGEWGDLEGVEQLYQAPVLAEDYLYPLERRLQERTEEQLAMGRAVMIYIEQNDVRSTPKRLQWVLAAHSPWTLPNNVAPEDREDAIRAAYDAGKRVLIVPYRRVSEGLNLQFLDTVIWYELAQNYYHLEQSNLRIRRLGATNLKQVIYLVYRGSLAHKKLIKLGEQSGSASMFAGDTPEGALVRAAGADRTTLARMSANVDQCDDAPELDVVSDDALRARFARRSQEANAALKRGRVWVGVEDTLPARLAALRAAWATRAAQSLPTVVALPTARIPAPAATLSAMPVATAPVVVPTPQVEARMEFGNLDFIGAVLRKKRVNGRAARHEANAQLDLFGQWEAPLAMPTTTPTPAPAAQFTLAL